MKTIIPERSATLQVQVGWLTSGRRRAVLFTAGVEIPVLPRWASLLVTEAGVFAFRPNAITGDGIQEAVNKNCIGDVLDYGISRKPESGTEIGAVVLRSQDGTEKLAVVTDSKHLESVTFRMKQLVDSGDTVALEPCEMVVREREASPLEGFPEVVQITTAGQVEALKLAAKADGYTPVFPTHLIIINREIVGCLSIDSLPLYRSWLHSKKVQPRQSLEVMNFVENTYRHRGVPIVATMLQPDSPFIPQMGRLGYKTWGGAVLFTKGI